MEFRSYPDRDLLMFGLADRIAGQLADFLRREGRATLALPGGETPGPAFDVLSGLDLDWANVTILPTDERWVPEDSPRSNAGLLRRRLLVNRAAAARLVALHTPGATPEAALPALTRAVHPLLPISVLVLGMGDDMHTASLFPGADRLAEALAGDAPPLMALRAPGAPEPRVTLTAPVLRGALNTHLLIIGADKRAALERAQTLPPDQAPVRAVLSNATVHWAE
jgi:6-phosphogluconolactonase